MKERTKLRKTKEEVYHGKAPTSEYLLTFIPTPFIAHGTTTPAPTRTTTTPKSP